MTPFAIGAGLALVVGLAMTFIGFDRDRAFYPTVLIVIAYLYTLFAAMAGGSAMLPEVAWGTVFAAIAVAGFKRDLRLVAAGLAAHGLFDFVHPRLVDNPGVPAFWPAFCGSYDVIAGAYLAWLLFRRSGRPS